MTKRLSQLQRKLRYIQSMMTRFYSVLLTQQNLSASQFSLLAIVTDDGPQKMGFLASQMFLVRSAVTHLVDRLTEQKLIRRIADPDDRRVCLIAASPAGKKAVKNIRKRTVDAFAEKLSAMTAREIQVVDRFYDVLSQTVREEIVRLKKERAL